MSLSRVHDPARRRLREIQWAAVAVGLYPGSSHDVLHCGVFFADARGADGVMMIHLEGHHQLTCEQPRDGFFWVELTVPYERARLFSRFCRKVEQRYPDGKLAYALKYRGTGLTQDGEFVSTEGRGLTCSTFVLEIFRNQGLPLVDVANWPTRESDRRAQKLIVEAIRTKCDDPDHVEAVRKEIGCARFRAEEVAAAAASDTRPAPFAYAEDLGGQIRTMVIKGPSGGPPLLATSI